MKPTAPKQITELKTALLDKCEELVCNNGGNCVQTTVDAICKCPKDSTGPKCDTKLPDGTILIKLGSKANDTEWPFDPENKMGLGTISPYENGGLAVAILPNGTVIYVPIPEDDETVETLFCKTGWISLNCQK